MDITEMLIAKLVNIVWMDVPHVQISTNVSLVKMTQFNYTWMTIIFVLKFAQINNMLTQLPENAQIVTLHVCFV
jgi:hypothetical protein